MHNLVQTNTDIMINRKFPVALLLGLFCFLLVGPSQLMAEGTKQTTATSSDRTHLLTNYSEYNDFGRYNGNQDQRLYIHIEDPENEVVYFGFSQFYDQPHWPNTGSSRTGYFRIKDPSGTVVWPTQGSPNGQLNNAAISTWQEAVNGPNAIVGSGGYNAFQFNPDGLAAGDYYIEFSASQGAYNSDDLIIPYYDITVATEGGTPTAIDGRVFSYNWAFMCPSIDYPNDYFDRDFTGELYIYSDDGFVSSIDFSQAEFQGAAFNIAFNSTGTANTGVFENDRASVEGSNVTFAEYRVFLNNPDITAFPNGTFGTFVTNADFPKLYGCPDDGEWFFRFAATEPGQVQVLIDANGNFEYDPGTADLLFTTNIVPYPGETPPYERDIPWDGLDGLGNPVPTNTNLTIEYSYSQGFYHLPVYDVEHLRTGMDVTSVRPVTPTPYDPKFRYDDEDITESLPGGQPALELNGCITPCHYWDDYEYGNVNTINTFWYAYRSETQVTIPFETPPPTCAGCPFTPFEILGTLFVDVDESGAQNGGEVGYQGVTVSVYNDANSNGVYNPGTDPLIDSDVTDSNGDYSLIGEIATEHLIRVELFDLPTNSSFTTTNQYGVQFFSTFDASCDNDFGFITFPIANTDYDTIQDQSIPLTVCVQDNDVDPLGNGVTTSIVTAPLNGGTATVVGDCIEYTAPPTFIGIDSLEYQICDASNLCDTAWVIIQVGDICDDGIDNDGDGIIDNYSPVIVVTATGTDPYCEGFTDGELDGGASGGSSPYDFEWIFDSNVIATTEDVSGVGAGSYTLAVTDQNGCKEEETVVLDALNCPPIANNDYNNTLVDIPVPGNVLTNDWDPNGDNILVNAPMPLTPPTNGSVVLNPDGSYVYTPDPGYEGDDSFTYYICDDGSPVECDTATVFIEVIPLTNENDPPIANADDAQTNQDVPVGGHLLINDYDPDGDNIIINTTPLSGPTNGSVVINPDGTFTYTPDPGFTGTDTYIYEICDDGTPSLCDTAVVTINVVPDGGPDNDPPFAGDDAAFTPEETPVSGQLLANDFDPNGDNIIINTTQISGPTNGSVVINPNGTYTYTPDPGFLGPDQFVYEICDDGTPSLCAQATCYITVYPDNNPPVATDDINGTLVDVPVSGNVITNDWDPDGDDITTTLLSGPPNGNVTLNPDGSYTYTPDPGFDGEDTFTYVLCDNGAPVLCDTAEVSIEVVPVTTANNPPIAQDDAAQTQVDVPVSGNVLVNDDDPDGDVIILNLTPLSGPNNGSVVLLANGSFTYTPDPGFEGTDVFTYSICDDVIPSLCDTAEVTINVIPDYNGPDNDPPFAGDDFALTPQEVPVSGQLLTNDFDVNGDNIIINTTQISGPSNGSVVINANGTYTYTPNSGFTGPDQFVYEICDDGTPSLCAQATVYITVYPDNNPPIAVNDFNNTLVDTPVSGSVITNDSDPDGDNLTVTTTPISGPTNGSLTLNPNGSYTYTPDPGFEGEDSFTYVVCDDGIPTLCDTADVTISVIPVTEDNDPPVANPDAYVTLEDVPISGNILVNDDDPDGDNIILNVNPLTGPSNGSVTVSPTGAITYTPNPGFIGQDSFTYEICDDGTPVLCDTTTVTIIVTPDYSGPSNDPPFAGDDAALTPMDVPVSGQLLTNDFDPNGDNIIINTTQISGPTNGSVVINSNGTYTYTPNPGYIGPDQFVYEICDDGAPSLCAQATCYITVYPGPGISWTIVEPLCNGQSNGSIDITVTNAALPLTFSWSNGATTEDLTNVPAGTYVVTVTDAEGSVLQQTIELTEPEVLGVVVDVQDETTVNGCDGSATANPTGGTAPYTYLWSDGQTTQTASNLCAGIYEVTVTDANGCEVTTSNVINPPSCDLDVLVTGQDADCNGSSDGSALATPITSQNNTPFTYLWNTGATTQSITGIPAGPYSVTVTDAIGCTASGSVVVSQPAPLSVSTTVVDEQIFGGCDGSATANPTGGTSPYAYDWSDGQQTQTASNLCPGNYTVVITDAHGCTTQTTITVNELSCSGFSVAINTYSLSCNGAADGAAIAVVSGGTAPFTYFWPTGGATVDSISGLGAGTVTVIVTDSVNCEQTLSADVTQPDALQATTAVDPVTCHGLANGAIELTVTGGTTPYSFLWSNGATSEDLNNLGPGTYNVDVTDANGCTAFTSGTVTEPDTLGATSVDVDVTCFEGSDGSIDLTATGGLGPYQYAWDHGPTTEDVSGLSAGSYTVTFVDQNACVFVYTTSIDEANEFTPTITADGPTTFCDGDSVVLTATTGAEYLWSTGDTTQMITVLASGIYSVNVITPDGCEGDSDPIQVTVNANPNPTVNPVGPTTFCDGGSVTLTTGSFASYQWSTGEQTQSIVVTASGTYTVTVTDGNGCEGTSAPLTVTVNNLPEPTVTAGGPTTFCQGNSVTLTSSAASSYQWSNGETTQSIVVTTTGSWTVTVTDANGCEGTSDPVETTALPLPTPTITPDGPTIFCDGDSVVLTSSPAEDYLWSTGETTQSITVFATGTFTVTVTDTSDCVGTSAPISVTVNNNPTPTITANGDLEFCVGDSVTLSASLGTSYLWNTGATAQSITVYATGDFWVEVSNGAGCSGVSDTTEVTVYDNPTPTITALGPTEFCDGDDVVLLATAAQSYTWSTGATSQAITVSQSGQFWVTITDVNGCSGASDTTDVTVYPNPTPTITADGPLEFCDGDSVTLTSSTAASYLWSNGATTQSTVVFTSGNYSVTVTDANGCEGTSAPVNVIVNELPFSTIFATGPTEFCEGDSVDLVARESAAYLWSNGDTTRIITVTETGTYSVINYDENGCQRESNEITVTVYPNPDVSVFASGPLTFCEGDEVTLTAFVTNSPQPHGFIWNTGETGSVITVQDSGSYSVIAQSPQGCLGYSDTTEIDTWDLPEPEVTTVGTPSFCAGDTIFLTTTEEFETYLWTTGDTTQTTIALQTGFYTVEVTDTNGCVGVSPESLITVNQNPDPTTTPDGTVEICQGDTITITSVEAASYLWTTGDTTQSILVWQAGIYNVTATDSSGCTGTSSDVIVLVNPLPTPTIVADDTLDFCAGGFVGLSTQEYESYLWSTGAISQNITVFQSGAYSVTVTDSAGCASATAHVDVTVYEPPVVTVTTTGPTQFCFGDSVVLTSSPGSSYLWSNGATSQSITVFTSGSFQVEVTDENGCTGLSPLVTIEVYNLPNIDIIADGPTEFCLGDSVVLTATGGQSYLWSTGDTTTSIVVYNTGSYFVHGTNQFGCFDTSSSIAVTVNDPPVVTVFPDGPTEFCDGGSVTLVAGGADTYVWSTGSTGTSIVVNASGSYSVTGMDANGCTTETGSIEVTVYPNPEPVVTADGPTAFCDGDTVVLTSTVADNYLWSTGATTQSIIVTTSGSYTVTVTDSLGCSGTSSPINVTVFDNPVPTVSVSGPDEFCLGDSVTLTSTFAEEYLWSTGDTTQSITVYATGSYTVEVTDEGGCTGVSDPVDVTVFQPPVPTITADGPTIACEGETIVLTASESSTYLWSTGSITQSITVTETGLYTVTVTDANGCEGEASIEITINPVPTPLPVITADGPTTFCSGDSVTLSADTWESYLWSTGDTTQSITVDATGLYVVTVTNEYGCPADAAGVVVTVHPNPVPVIQATGNGGLCFGDSITLGVGLFNSYLWNTGDTTQFITVDTVGAYNVTVTNSFGCEGTSNDFNVTVNPVPEVTVEADGPTTVCQGGQVTLNAVGDGPYLWNTGDTTQSIVVVNPGDYFVTVTDTITGCEGTSNVVTVDNHPDFVPEIVADGPTAFCSGDTVNLTVVEGSVFDWSTGDTTQTISVTESGIYIVSVVDSNGCSGTVGQTVTVLPQPIAEIIPNQQPPFCAGDTIVLTALFNLGGDYVWNTGDSTQSITVTESGVYTVTVTNFFGCSAEASLPVLFLPLPNADVFVDGPTSICEGDEVSLTALALPGLNTFVWSPNGETSQTITVSEPGSYSVTVTSITGCDATSDLVVIDVVPGPVADAGPDQVICIGDTAELSVTGDNVTWTPGGTDPTIYVNPTDDTMYIVEVMNDGCDQVAIDTVWVITQAYPHAAFGIGDTHLGQPVEFSDSSTTQPLFSWDWDFGDGNGSVEQNPSNDYEEPGEYTVTLIVGTENGCTDTVTEVITVEEFFIITNVLTPNGDNYNDYVWITSSLADLIEAKVYNRWGLSVWEGIGKDVRFAGKTTEGVDLPAGTYYYTVNLDYGEAGNKELTGFITLIRE